MKKAFLLSILVHCAVLFGFVMPQTPEALPQQPILSAMLKSAPEPMPAAASVLAETQNVFPDVEKPAPVEPLPERQPEPVADLTPPPEKKETKPVEKPIKRKVASNRVKPVQRSTPVISTAHAETDDAPRTPPAPSGAENASDFAESAPVTSGPVVADATQTPDSSGQATATGAVAGIHSDEKQIYKQALLAILRAQQKYPKLARMRRWEGTSQVELSITGKHQPAMRLVQSSGYALLDEQALEMLRVAVERMPVPEELQQSSFSLKIPITFNLRTDGANG